MKKVSKKKGPNKKGPNKKVPKKKVPNKKGPNKKGPKKKGSNKKVSKKKGPNVNVPNKDDDVTPILAADGEEYTPEPHWIRSARSSSHFKGVSYDRTREQWRVSEGGKQDHQALFISISGV